MMIATVSVVGLGYIGLPTAAVLAAAGCHVIGVDINRHAVDTINEGRIHIVETGLGEMVEKVVSTGNLRATATPEAADAFLIAVPTPVLSDHAPDMSYIQSACEAIAPVLKKGDTVILESTSPVGATEQVAAWLGAARPDLTMPAPGNDGAGDLFIAYCPERVLPGNVLFELVRNDRVLGGLTPACSRAAAAVYALFVEGECILTDARTAEMCKLTENAFRDVNIAFANELSLICDQLSIDVWELIRLANRHPRVNILQPGPGVGGHCIAVDPWFIVASAPEQSQLIRTARCVNDGKPEWVLSKVRTARAKVAKTKGGELPVRIACLGLAFKPNIDDLRESPALAICERLADDAALEVLAVEPHIDTLPDTLAGRVQLVDVEKAVATADIVLLLVDHALFRDAHVHLSPAAELIDTRGLWRAEQRRTIN